MNRKSRVIHNKQKLGLIKARANDLVALVEQNGQLINYEKIRFKLE